MYLSGGSKHAGYQVTSHVDDVHADVSKDPNRYPRNMACHYLEMYGGDVHPYKDADMPASLGVLVSELHA